MLKPVGEGEMGPLVPDGGDGDGVIILRVKLGNDWLPPPVILLYRSSDVLEMLVVMLVNKQTSSIFVEIFASPLIPSFFSSPVWVPNYLVSVAFPASSRPMIFLPPVVSL